MKKILQQLKKMTAYALFGVLIQCMFYSLLIADEGNAQKSMEEIFVNVRLENEGIKAVFGKIEQQTELDFVYSKNILDKEIQITTEKRYISVADLLRILSVKGDLQFKRINGNIYVSRKKRKEAPVSELIERAVAAIEVSGKVTSQEDGEPLPGVNVLVKGGATGTITDIEGNYQIVTEEDAVLVFSFIGYQSQEVSVANRNVINITLAPDLTQLNEVIVTGYRTQARGTVTGSVATVNSDEIKDVPVDNLSNALSGRLSGVTVSQAAGTPGMESNIKIRAAGTFNNADPLYVIDGVINDKFAFDGLNPNEVESITILKDGAAASIYGSRAANGVVLVTTKRGQEGAPVLSYNGTFGIQTPTRIPPSLNAFEHATTINNALRYNNVPETDARYYTQDELDYFSEHSWNWVEELWRNPTTTQHALNVSGGTSSVRYFLGGSYIYSTGSFDNLSYRKANLRANVDVSITRNLTASMDISTDSRGTDGPSWDTGNWRQEDLYKALALRTSMVPPYINGIPVGNWVEWHPGVVIDKVSGYNKRKWNGLNTTLTLDYKVPFVEGLSAKVMYNRYQRESFTKQFNLPYNMTYFNTLGENGHIVGDEPQGPRPRSTADYLREEYRKDFSYQLNGQLNYQRSFGKHNLGALFVYEQRETDELGFSGRRDKFISFAIDQFAAGSSAPENSQVDGGEEQSARISYIGLADYNYDDRYLLQASFRYDGSVIFAPENRWGFFPSVAAGWRLSNESFFNSAFIDDLKLRASVGVLGNDAVGGFQWLQSYNISDGAVFGSPTNGLEPGNLVNRDITWEKSISYNAGIDSRFWERKMDFKLDLFYRHTYDILGSRQTSIPSTFGAELPDENYQEIDTRGFEVELGYNSNFGSTSSPVNYHIRGNFGYATNEVIQLDEAENLRPYQSEIGRPTIDNDYLALIATGILRTQADLDALPAGYTIDGEEPKLGMLNYQDLRGPNSDEPDGRITDDDRAWVADYDEPPMNFGLSLGGSWKALSLNVLVQGLAGHQIMMHTNGRDVQRRAEESSYGYWADSWTPENIDAAYPGYRGTGYRTRFPQSSFWLRDGSFVRLKNVSLSYSLPQGLTNSLHLNDIRLFFTGTNLLLLYDNIGDWGYDPEVNNIRAYPMMKTYSFGLNINL